MVKKVFKKKISFKGEENPFNLKLNREKHTVLGQNTKGTKGLRCISRANIHLKRKELYNKSKKASQKANNFVDRRLLHEDEEDSVTARFVQERKQKLKKNKYNLNDEENLTHGGVPLKALKNLKDQPIGSDDDDEQLGAAFVNKAHFGGADQQPLSHKEIIDKLILESKQKKQEQKIERELTLDLTEKLDREWKASISGGSRVPKALEPLQFAKKKDTILELLQATDKPKMVPLSTKKADSFKEDPYNILEMALKYSKKSTPITRTKTAEELEEEEKEKQLVLEQERQQRMSDYKEVKAKNNDHVSADSIIDDFDLDPITVEENVNEKPSSDKDSDSEVDDDSNQSDGLSEGEDNDENNSDAQSEVCDDVLDHANNSEPSEIPINLDEFEEYLENYHCASAADILAAVGNIIKPFLKAKSEKKQNKLISFFDVLLEYSFKHLTDNSLVSENLASHLFDIAAVSPLKTAEKILSSLDNEQDFYQKCKSKKKKNNFPRFESLLILKYCSVLYSVSDFIHPVVTPAILFMCDILASEFFVTFQNIESRLFICSIILDCVTQSKRLVPEVLAFLNKMLKLACPHKTELTAKKQMIDLVINEMETSSIIADINVFCPGESMTENKRKLSIILRSVNLLNKFSSLYVGLPSFNNLFSDTLSICSELPTKYYPTSLTDAILILIQGIKNHNGNLLPLTYENTRPKPLKLFEPAYESKFTKKDDIKKKLKLLKNVSQKIRKEEKDMLREMRRDLQVVASEKLKEQLESDAERKRKVKELYHDLAVQESDYKKLMKSKP